VPTLSPAARLYSQARRNLLPRHERLVAVAGRWQHAQLERLGVEPEVTLRCGDVPYVATYEISEKILARLHPGLRAPALLSVVRLPVWTPAEVLRPGLLDVNKGSRAVVVPPAVDQVDKFLRIARWFTRICLGILEEIGKVE